MTSKQRNSENRKTENAGKMSGGKGKYREADGREDVPGPVGCG